jgi:hypothetical protein
VGVDLIFHAGDYVSSDIIEVDAPH